MRQHASVRDKPDIDELLQFDIYVLPLLTCPFTSYLVYDAFYTQNTFFFFMNDVPILTPAVCKFVRHIQTTVHLNAEDLGRLARGADTGFNFPNLDTVDISLACACKETRSELERLVEKMAPIQVKARRLNIVWQNDTPLDPRSLWNTALSKSAMAKMTILPPDGETVLERWERCTLSAADGRDAKPEQYFEDWTAVMDSELPRTTKKMVWF